MTKPDTVEIKQHINAAIDKNNAMLSEMCAVYLKAHPELTLEDISLVNVRHNDGKTEYYIANKSIEGPWKDNEILLRELKELREAVQWTMSFGFGEDTDLLDFCDDVLNSKISTETDKHHAQVLLKAITAEEGE